MESFTISNPENPTSDTTFYEKVEPVSQKAGISKAVKKGNGNTMVIPIVANETLAEEIQNDMRDISSKIVNEKPLGKITRKSYFRPRKTTSSIGN